MVTGKAVGSIILCVTYHFARLGINVVVPLHTLGVFQFDLIDQAAGAVLVQFGIADREALVLGNGLLLNCSKSPNA